MTTTFANGSPHPDDFDPAEPANAFSSGRSAAPADLSAFDADYDEAEAPSQANVPDGKYQVRVQRVELGRSQAGDPMLKWDLLVLSGTHAGRHIFKNSVITHRSLPFVKGDLQTLGVELPKFSDLPHHLDALLDQTLEVTQRTKGDYTNVYFNRRITVPAGAANDAAAIDADSIPF
ncbi:MAG: DUF669 domain-containing protein [Phycisphaeraceae bacterium]|nr:DUF669 domain-containing protein [Phycisphaeraceae bacterium]